MIKEEIGQEIAKWYKEDPNYCYVLILTARDEGLITEEEAIIAKQDLDKVYNRDKDVSSTRGNYMMKTIKKLGFTKNKILWNFIDQFPTTFIKPAENCIMRPNIKKIIAHCNLPSTIDFYALLSDIIKEGYIEHAEGQLYKINFDRIKEDAATIIDKDC